VAEGVGSGDGVTPGVADGVDIGERSTDELAPVPGVEDGVAEGEAAGELGSAEPVAATVGMIAGDCVA